MMKMKFLYFKTFFAIKMKMIVIKKIEKLRANLKRHMENYFQLNFCFKNGVQNFYNFWFQF